MLQCYGHSRVLGIPIPKTLVIWASLLIIITLGICVTVRVTGDAHNNRVLGMGMPKTGDAHIPVATHLSSYIPRFFALLHA